MINPTVVLNFLDAFGTWDPALIFVMVGALLTVGIGFKVIFKNFTPIFDKKFHIPINNEIDTKLILGSIIFGIGWGLSGYCPGPAIASISYGQFNVFGFIVAMFVGFKVSQLLQSRSDQA